MTIEELIEECKKRGLKVEQTPDPQGAFNVMVRYNRGLGPEYATLDPVRATTVGHAKEQGWLMADDFLKRPGMEKAVIGEVRVRPL